MPPNPAASPLRVEIHHETGTSVLSFGLDSRIEFSSTDDETATITAIQRVVDAIFRGEVIEVVEEDETGIVRSHAEVAGLRPTHQSSRRSNSAQPRRIAYEPYSAPR
jgi:hypothetical protein